jgi:hypothetical protein
MLGPSAWIYGANMVYGTSATAGLRFDPSLGTVRGSGFGGEETVYQDAIRQRGRDIIWLCEMHIIHYVEPIRMTLEYLTRYAYDRGRTFMRLHPRSSELHWLGAPRWTWRLMIQAYARYIMLGMTANRLDSIASLWEFLNMRGMVDEAREQDRNHWRSDTV